MFFSKENKYDLDLAVAKTQIFTTARKRIISYPMHATELQLNVYCVENYKKSLKQICLELLKRVEYALSDTDIIITFLDQKDDELASLLTYGNEEIPGSNILRKAFK